LTDAAGIDAVMRESIALRFPVLDAMAVVDFGGLDTFSRVWAQMFPEMSATREVPASIGGPSPTRRSVSRPGAASTTTAAVPPLSS
jgi:hypothetical protein